jgi:amino acid transporter
MLALLFSVQSIPNIQSSTYAIPIAQLYYDAVGRKLTLMCLTVIALAQGMAAVTAFTASSRLFYALARDNAFPLKNRFMYLNRFQAPVYGVWLSVFIGCIISCAYIGSTIAVRVNYLFHPILITSNVHSSMQSCPLRLFPSCLVIFNLSLFAYSGQIRKFPSPKYAR